MAEQMEILLKTEHKPEAAAVLEFLDEMTPAEQRDFLLFIQGARYTKSLESKKTAAARRA